MKTWTRRLAVIAAALVLLIAGAFMWANAPRPEGVSDAAADAMATRMVNAVDGDAWNNTGAVKWTYGDRYTHLWDRQRHLVRVEKDGWSALVDINQKKGIASQDGVALKGAANDEAVQTAYAAWANDSFWLAATHKAFDGGTTRSRVTLADGEEALLVQYGAGGVTPGDAYLWHTDESGRPVSWQMWVSIIPVGGVSATWEDWVQLRTGAWISTRHQLGPLDIHVTNLDGAATLAELVPGDDPFAPLLSALAK